MMATLSALLLLGAFFVFSQPDHAPALTGRDHDRVERELQQVRAQVEKVKADARAGIRRPFRLSVTDEQLNLLLAEDARVHEKLADRKIDEAWVRIQNGFIVATVIRDVGGMPMQIRATLVPELAGDREVRAKVHDIRFGRLAAPKAAAQRLADEVGRLLSRQVTDQGVRLRHITVKDNAIHLEGTTGVRPSS